MKIKKMLIASMIVGATLMGGSAYAADVGKTDVVTLVSDGDGGFNAHFGNVFGKAATNNPFSDKFKFSLGGDYDSSASLTSTYLKSGKDLQITNFALVQYDPITNAILHTFGGDNTTSGGVNPTDTWELAVYGLSAGSYYVAVDGMVTGANGGTYASDLTISVAAVPEPETYGMMAAGLGLLGLVARRKKAKQQA